MNKIKIYLYTLLFASIFAGVAGCSEDNDTPKEQYGYVQFKLMKKVPTTSAEATRAVEKLDKLADAHKIKVFLQYDGNTIAQTMVLNAYNAENAEYGLRSAKLRLLVGDYSVIGYTLYDELDNELLSSDVDGCSFSVVGGGLHSQELFVNTTLRGMASFKLVKEWDTATTRALNNDGSYPFSSIKAVDIIVQNTFTKEYTTIEKIKVKHVEDFGEGSADEALYPGKNAEISYALCDTVVYLVAGTYRVHNCITYSDKNARSVLGNEYNTTSSTFVVEDNKESKEVEVPVNISQADEYIKDYIALKEIWEALDGPNWSYAGDVEADGANWNFNKEIDLWGDQPGVQLHANGRVATISLEGFGPKGVVPDAIGQLTELSILYLGSHSDLLGGHIFGRISPSMSDEQRMAVRMDYADKILDKDFRLGLSEAWQKTIEVDANERPLKKGISLKNIQFGDMTNGIVGISRALQRCTKLEQFFIANCPITVDSFFRDIEPSSPFYAERENLKWENMNMLLDLEIYNCPKLTALPMEMLASIPELQMLNVACNKGISGDQLKSDWIEFINGNSGPRIQVIYMGYNNLKEFPVHEELKKMVKLGMIDCASNQIETVHPFGKEITLAKVYLDYNKIKTIPVAPDGYFCGFSQLESFTASHNEMTEFPDIFNAKSLYVCQSVDFSYNKISGFENGENARGINAGQVNLSDNYLETFPGILFKKGSPINYLILAGNGMKEIPAGSLIGEYSYMLEAIDLSYNKLTELPDDFFAHNLPYLAGIDLSYNSFSTFPVKPLTIDGLNRFFIRYQRDENGNRTLKEWPTGLSQCPSLSFFLIGGNDLRKIDDVISPYIYYFEIADNPNISIDLSTVCDYIAAGYYMLVYDRTQDIRGCDAIILDK